MTTATSATLASAHGVNVRSPGHGVGSHEQGSRSVLVVEDDQAVAKVHYKYVTSTPGFSVCGIARSGGEAREMIASLKPDVVLMDLELPGVSGLSLLRNLRQRTQPTEVIVVSGHASPQVVRSCMQLGAIDYLVKPFWLSRLAQALALVEARSRTFGLGAKLDQRTIDQIRGAGASEESGGAGISPERLERIRELLVSAGQALSAEQVASVGGMSRVTARRYLEHLVALGQCTVDSEAPGGPGRPSKFYRPWLSRPVGG